VLLLHLASPASLSVGDQTMKVRYLLTRHASRVQVNPQLTKPSLDFLRLYTCYMASKRSFCTYEIEPSVSDGHLGVSSASVSESWPAMLMLANSCCTRVFEVLVHANPSKSL
jgi:hypothetical protein